MADGDPVPPASPAPFDFEAHQRRAADEYAGVRNKYERFAASVKHVLEACLRDANVMVHSVQARAKDVESFRTKAGRVSDGDPNRPKYEQPLVQITDLAGVRVITYFPESVDSAGTIIGKHFTVIEKADHTARAQESGRLGYLSVHYLVQLSNERCALPEYAEHRGLTAEVQVRTILQHAWAEIEHDIQYKSVDAIPAALKRRFMALAGLLELADREFESIQKQDATQRTEDAQKIAAGKYDDVEITPTALKGYLDKKLGPDGRMSAWSYEFTVRILRGCGFSSFAEIDQALIGIDDDVLSRAIYGSRMGQLMRFELMLLAALGERFLEEHPLRKYEDWHERTKKFYDQLEQEGLTPASQPRRG